jgi:hypothetical protein
MTHHRNRIYILLNALECPPHYILLFRHPYFILFLCRPYIDSTPL